MSKSFSCSPSGCRNLARNQVRRENLMRATRCAVSGHTETPPLYFRHTSTCCVSNNFSLALGMSTPLQIQKSKLWSNICKENKAKTHKVCVCVWCVFSGRQMCKPLLSPYLNNSCFPGEKNVLLTQQRAGLWVCTQHAFSPSVYIM